MFINGTYQILYIKTTRTFGDFLPIACLTSQSLSESSDTIDTTTRDNTGWKTTKPTNQEYSISFDGLDTTVTTDKTSFDILRLAKKERELIEWRLGTTTEYISGSAYITELAKEFPTDENVTFSGSLVGYGEYLSIPESILVAYRTRVEADGGSLDSVACLYNYIETLVNSGFYEKATIILPVAPGVKAGKVYCLKPTSGQDFTYDRGGVDNATRVNSSGLIEDVAEDVPRLDYSDGTCPSLLLEPSTTNLITYSEDFSDASWVKIASTITSNSDFSPKGDLNADKLIPNATNTPNHYVLFSATVLNLTDYTMSFFAKKGEYNYVSSFISVFGGSVTWDLDLGLVVLDEIGTAKIESYNDGWYRCSVSGTTNTTSFSYRIYASPFEARNISFSGDGASGVYVWGAQLEQQSYATSYVPSLLGVNGERNAETCNGAGSTSEINSTEGVLFFEGRVITETFTNLFRAVSISNNAISTKRIAIYYDDNQEKIGVVYVTPSGNTLSDLIDISVSYNDYIKIACVYNNTKIDLYLNGIKVDTKNLSFTLSANDLNQLNFDLGNGAGEFYGRCKQIQVFDNTNVDLEALTGFSSFSEMAQYLNYA